MQKRNKTSSNPNPLSFSKFSYAFCSFFCFFYTPFFYSSLYADASFKTIAITQIVPHKSLDEAKAGVIDQLKKEGFEVGKNLKIIEENAQGNITTANLIARKFIEDKSIDVIIPISTPSALSLRSLIKKTKTAIVFSSVSDPVGAGLVSSLDKADPQITGAMDKAENIELQALMKTLSPKIKTIGILFNSGEANSVKSVADFKSKLDTTITIVEKTIPNSKLVPEAVLSLLGKVDAIYIPSDNTVFSALPKLIQMARKHKIPTFTNDPDSVKLGIFACYGYSQFSVGQTAGHLVATLLKGAPVGSLKVSTPEKADILVNVVTAKELGISIPKEFKKQTITQVSS
jgi:putative ABC transport system substrate-binding protein